MRAIIRLLAITWFSLVAVSASTVLAQGSYPGEPIRIIVPYTAGGSADFMARMIGQRLTETWKEQVLVENRGGAGGNLGMEAAQKSPPDGYTLAMINNSQAINESLYSKLPFVLLKDYEVDNWYGLMAPAGTPREVLAKLEAEIRKIVNLPDSRSRMANVGIDPALTTGDELMALLKTDVDKFGRVVKFANIKGE